MIIPKVTVPEGELGPWAIKRFEVSEEHSKLCSLRSMFHPLARGRVPAGRYTKLTRNGSIIMSDTPDEMRDHYDFVRRAHGHVLINGLGLGMALGAVLAKPEVERVTVVEIDRDVIALVGGHYACGRLHIIQASAYDYQPYPRNRYGAVWHDVWDNLCADNLPEMTALKRKYGRRCDWQGCWGEAECRAAKKRRF